MCPNIRRTWQQRFNDLNRPEGGRSRLGTSTHDVPAVSISSRHSSKASVYRYVDNDFSSAQQVPSRHCYLSPRLSRAGAFSSAICFPIDADTSSRIRLIDAISEAECHATASLNHSAKRPRALASSSVTVKAAALLGCVNRSRTPTPTDRSSAGGAGAAEMLATLP